MVANASGQLRLTPTFMVVAGLFITCLITANIIAVKLVVIFGHVLPAAIVIFPLSYIIGDILTEVYGYRQARAVIWLGFLCNLVAVAAIWVGGLLTPASFWGGQEAYDSILGYTPRLLMASFVAYLIGELANSTVLAKMKIWTQGRWLWSRTISSTIIGQGLDSAVFITLAFAGSDVALVRLVLTQWTAKVIYEAAATPLTYMVVAWIKKREGLDHYDHGTSFNPIPVTGR